MIERDVPRVVNLRRKQPYDVYIGRPSEWGNPFVVGRDGSRDQVIEKYRQHLWSQLRAGEKSLDDLTALAGARLGCYCSPLPCHGDVIVAAVKWAITWMEQEELARMAGEYNPYP